jgi:hypothetical protein
MVVLVRGKEREGSCRGECGGRKETCSRKSWGFSKFPTILLHHVTAVIHRLVTV